jgi:hypothetical protein
MPLKAFKRIFGPATKILKNTYTSKMPGEKIGATKAPT